jgi:hypothetical protein
VILSPSASSRCDETLAGRRQHIKSPAAVVKTLFSPSLVTTMTKLRIESLHTILKIQKRRRPSGHGICLRRVGDQSANSASSTDDNRHDSLTNLVSSSKVLKHDYIKADLFDKTDATVLAIGTTAPFNSRMANMVTARPCYDKIKFDPS